ncbi:unnamed protein product [Owenia fusiformis]|uniref:NTR domain-containing protein n=1 Tax=Owenia fusiformis TaxID=6347 RepID=A0A8S4N2S8_OWEFU|nr:unnamed protein product [Owenia fusiformis]
MWHVQLLLVLSCTTFLHLSDACKCRQPHPQEAYCQRDFVIKGNVKSQTVIGDQFGEKRFKVKVLQIFKGPTTWHTGQQIFIYTAVHGATCGVSLTKRTTYLLIGSLSNPKKPWITTCGFNREWSDIKKTVIDGISGDYEPNCACKICRGEPCGGMCPLFWNSTNCFYEHAVCRVACPETDALGNPACRWDTPEPWWKCVKGQNVCRYN